jgi:hypothetical protein
MGAWVAVILRQVTDGCLGCSHLEAGCRWVLGLQSSQGDDSLPFFDPIGENGVLGAF